MPDPSFDIGGSKGEDQIDSGVKTGVDEKISSVTLPSFPSYHSVPVPAI